MTKRVLVADDMPNEVYHKDFPDYISSTTLKKYRLSGLHFQQEQEDGFPKSPALLLGTLWHDVITSKHKSGRYNWEDEYVIFHPKINEKTGKPYGEDTEVQKAHRLEALSSAEGKTVVSKAQVDTALIMADNIFANPDHPSYEFFMKAFNAGTPEVSYFIDDFYKGINIRIRPDLDIGKVIFDYKSFGRSIEEFPRAITEMGYDISAGMYVEGKREYYRREHGVEVDEIRFFWVVQESNPPYDWAIFSAEHFLESGIDKFYKCLERHHYCKETGVYFGVASTIADKNGIFRPEPAYYQKQLNKLL
jgi:hypothetical protein